MTVQVLGPTDLDAAASLLADGLVVGIPTDTVYGLAARLGDDRAVVRLFEAKGRPETVPIAVLCASAGAAAELSASWTHDAARLAARFWPGALTIVVDAPRTLAASLGAVRGVGLRVPADATCAALLERTGPLAVTSANRHGGLPATTAGAVVELFASCDVAAVLDDGPRAGEVSSVVDLTGKVPAVLREAAWSAAELLGALSAG